MRQIADLANQQAVVEPDARQAVSGGGAPTHALGSIARREKRRQRSGAPAIPIPANFREVLTVQC